MSTRYTPMPASFFEKNREKLRGSLLKDSFAVVHSNDMMPRNGDCYHPYRQQSDFYYLSGIDQEESVLLLNPDAVQKKDKAVLFIKETNDLIKVWEGAKLSKQEAANRSGIENVRWLSEFNEVMESVVQAKEYYYYNSNGNERFSSDVESRDDRENRAFLRDKSIKQLGLNSFLESLRVIKDNEEIACIKTACGITKKAFDRVLQKVKPGMWEYELEAEISHEFTVNRASGHAYSPIIAGGANSCVLHYIDNNEVLKDGDIALLDFGAEYGNYASDLTRTIPVNGRFSKRQKQVYDATYKVFLHARKNLVKGVSLKDFQSTVVEEMEKQLVGLGLFSLKDLRNQDKDSPLYKKYFMHGTSHFMGLDVHDVGDRNSNLKPGMVLTCEPGIYIPEECIGVRIENDILITNESNEDLMADIPIESDDIEDLMNL